MASFVEIVSHGRATTAIHTESMLTLPYDDPPRTRAACVDRPAKPSLSKLPKYLFRVYDTTAMGINSQDFGFHSGCAKHGYDPLDFDTVSPGDLRRLVKDHLRNEKLDSPFISFSASLLTTIQRAIWKLHRGLSENLTIAIIDTAAVVSPIIFHVPTLLKFYNIAERRQFIEFDCTEEYIAANSFIAKDVAHVRLELLIANGLYSVLPGLKYNKVKTRVGAGLDRLRRANFDVEYPVTTHEVGLASCLARLFFEGPRHLDIFCAFLALRRRSISGPEFEAGSQLYYHFEQYREQMAFKGGNLQLEQVSHIEWTFDATEIRSSRHGELRQFCEIGKRMIKHAREVETRLGKRMLAIIWTDLHLFAAILQKQKPHLQPAKGKQPSGEDDARKIRDLSLKYEKLSMAVISKRPGALEEIVKTLQDMRKRHGDPRKNHKAKHLLQKIQHSVKKGLQSIWTGRR